RLRRRSAVRSPHSTPPRCAEPYRGEPVHADALHRVCRGSVVHPDAVSPKPGNYRCMAYAEHLREESPVAFETATVGDAMSHGVISCPPETPLRVVARMMTTYGVHAIFVFEHGDGSDEEPRLWAVVSDLDLVAATQLDLDMLTAGSSAVTPLVTVAT